MIKIVFQRVTLGCFMSNKSAIRGDLILLAANCSSNILAKAQNDVMVSLGILLNHWRAVTVNMPANILKRTESDP